MKFPDLLKEFVPSLQEKIRLDSLPRLIALWVAGSLSLVIATLLAVQLGLNFASAAFVLLIIIVLFSLLDSFISSAIFSVVGVGLLNFFLTEPMYTFVVADAQDILTLLAFLITSLAVTSLVRRVRSLGEMQREQARLLDVTTDAVIVRDRDSKVTYWNRGAELLYGWNRAEALGRNSHELLRAVLPVPIAEIKQTVAQSGRWEGEIVHTTRSGAEVTVASRWSRNDDEQRGMLGVMENNTDITDRKRVEEALRRTQASYLGEAQRLSHTGSFGWNTSTGKIFWSEETFRIFGYEPTTEPSFDLIAERTHPEDVAALRRALDRAVAGEKEIDLEQRLLMPDGSVKNLHLVAHAAANGHNGGQFIGAISDISARKLAYAALEQSELRYRHIFSHIPISLLQLEGPDLAVEFAKLRAQGVTDLSAHFEAHPHLIREYVEQLIIAEVNENAVRMLGGSTASDFVGQTVSRHWPDVSLDTVGRGLASRFRDDEYFREDSKWTTLDGRILDVVFTTMRFARIGYSPATSLVGVVDVSEMLRARELLNRMQADFAHAARVSVLGELTASIAHEINQPLAAIAANGQAGLRWLQRPNPDLTEVHELTRDIVADAERAASIIGRIRSMAARRSPETTLLALDDIIREALAFLRHELQSRRVVVLHYSSQDGAKVMGDRTQLQQVVVNLVVNSMQAMVQAESPRRTITIKSIAPDAATLRCQIDDSGPGIQPELRARLFESFFTTKDGGMGMGLPICRSIIEAHGGRISVDNTSAEGGACFSFTLPIAEQPS